MSMKDTKEAVWKRIPVTYTPNDIHSEHVWRFTQEYLHVHVQYPNSVIPFWVALGSNCWDVSLQTVWLKQLLIRILGFVYKIFRDQGSNFILKGISHSECQTAFSAREKKRDRLLTRREMRVPFAELWSRGPKPESTAGYLPVEKKKLNYKTN